MTREAGTSSLNRTTLALKEKGVRRPPSKMPRQGQNDKRSRSQLTNSQTN